METAKSERWVTQREIAERLCVSERHVEYIIAKWGHEKIVEMLEIRGYFVWFERVDINHQFWEIAE